MTDYLKRMLVFPEANLHCIVQALTDGIEDLDEIPNVTPEIKKVAELYGIVVASVTEDKDYYREFYIIIPSIFKSEKIKYTL